MFYVFPFNTLVEQTKKALDEAFKEDGRCISNIAVVNSMIPISNKYKEEKENDDEVGLYQLVNSIIILDEVQSYRNTIWTEIIHFLKAYAKVLNMKIIHKDEDFVCIIKTMNDCSFEEEVLGGKSPNGESLIL